VTTLTAAGVVEDYDEAVRASLAQVFATEAGVALSAVTVEVAPASVVLTVSIAVSTPAQSDAISNTLSARLASATAASAILGISVESTPAIDVVRTDGCLAGTLDVNLDQPGVSCVDCPPGYACGFNTTLVSLAAARCAPGFYCPLGSTVPLAAPTGHAATGTGNSQATPCAPGTYSGQTASAACAPCPAGFECPAAGTSAPVQCPVGTSRDATSVVCLPESCDAKSGSPILAVVFIFVGLMVGAGLMLIIWAVVPKRIKRTKVEPKVVQLGTPHAAHNPRESSNPPRIPGAHPCARPVQSRVRKV